MFRFQSTVKHSLWIAGLLLVAQAISLAAEPLRDDLGAADRQRVVAVTAPTDDFSRPEAFEAMSGGAGTLTRAAAERAFSHASSQMAFARREDFHLGEALFSKLWVSAPASTQASDGLGPLFNARACASCHLRNGRGLPPDGYGDEATLILKLYGRYDFSDAGTGEMAVQVATPDPVYGQQLQTRAVQGQQAEAVIETTYQETAFAFADGTMAWLRRPSVHVRSLGFGPLAADTIVSPRIGPPLHGLGLVERIAAGDLQALADPDDRNGDGISGRLARVIDPQSGEPAPGRFGLKAAQATIRAQAAAAFSSDIGLSTSLFPAHGGDCTGTQTACMKAPHGAQARLDPHEVPDNVLDLVTFFSGNIAVPARRDVSDPDVLRGKELFYRSGCIACHTPKFVTRRSTQSDLNAFQLIWPYSDFLLHDMGPGLADGAGGAGGASELAREWRTAPLWGIGLTKDVSPQAGYLHDGRARDLVEAILWHGGEALRARDAFAAMKKTDRDALLRFVRSL